MPTIKSVPWLDKQTDTLTHPPSHTEHECLYRRCPAKELSRRSTTSRSRRIKQLIFAIYVRSIALKGGDEKEDEDEEECSICIFEMDTCGNLFAIKLHLRINGQITSLVHEKCIVSSPTHIFHSRSHSYSLAGPDQSGNRPAGHPTNQPASVSTAIVTILMSSI